MKKTIKGTITRETEKAVLMNVPCTDQSGHKCFSAEKWFPKSAIKLISDNTYIVADWLANKVDFSEKVCVAYSVIE